MRKLPLLINVLQISGLLVPFNILNNFKKYRQKRISRMRHLVLLLACIFAAVQAQSPCGDFTTTTCSATQKCVAGQVDIYTVRSDLLVRLICLGRLSVLLSPWLRQLCNWCLPRWVIRMSAVFTFLAVDHCKTPDVALYGQCSPDAKCTALLPGISCTCNAGYYGDGFTCTGVIMISKSANL